MYEFPPTAGASSSFKFGATKTKRMSQLRNLKNLKNYISKSKDLGSDLKLEENSGGMLSP